MSLATITIPDMLASLAERIRVEEARLVVSADRQMIERHRAEIRMLQAMQREIAGPETYLTEDVGP